MIEELLVCRVLVTWLDKTEQPEEFIVDNGDPDDTWICLVTPKPNDFSDYGKPVWYRMSDIAKIEVVDFDEENEGGEEEPNEDGDTLNDPSGVIRSGDRGTCATLHFSFPEQKTKFFLASKADELAYVIADIQRYLEKRLEEDHSNTTLKNTLEYIQKSVREIGMALRMENIEKEKEK